MPRKKIINRPGYDALWLWFNLSYASFLTLPRVLMHEMPDRWQKSMAKLLNEYDETYCNLPDISSFVSFKSKNKFIKPPSWMLNYRHPDKEEIALLKTSKAQDTNL
jgi:hypothetical protein